MFSWISFRSYDYLLVGYWSVSQSFSHIKNCPESMLFFLFNLIFDSHWWLNLKCALVLNYSETSKIQKGILAQINQNFRKKKGDVSSSLFYLHDESDSGLYFWENQKCLIWDKKLGHDINDIAKFICRPPTVIDWKRSAGL